MPFQKGHKLAPGGPRPNSGRPTDEVKKKFQKMLHESNAHKRFQEILETETNREIFLKAYQISLDRAFGKPQVEVDHKGLEGISILSFIHQAETERGLGD